MKPCLKNIQSEIKKMAEEGRAARTEARQLAGKPRYYKQQSARDTGHIARQYLLAYHILRGKNPALSESPTTRWTGWDFPKTDAVLAIVEEYAEGTPEELEALLRVGRQQLDMWRGAVRYGKAEAYHAALQADSVSEAA